MDYLNIPTSPSLATIGFAASFLLIGLGSVWIAQDFHAWTSFGTGGTPPNLKGYIRMSKFRIRRAWSGDSLMDASKLPRDGPSFLPDHLPTRREPIPRLLPRTLPQRQYPEPLAFDVRARLHDLPSKYANKYARLLVLKPSITEGGTVQAIYARPELPGRGKSTHDAILGDEIAHVHPEESSAHVWLTQTDARKVVEAKWGQRFPLASLGILDEGFVFLYAPRTMEEVDVVETLFRAGIGHLTGERLGE